MCQRPISSLREACDSTESLYCPHCPSALRGGDGVILDHCHLVTVCTLSQQARTSLRRRILRVFEALTDPCAKLRLLHAKFSKALQADGSISIPAGVDARSFLEDWHLWLLGGEGSYPHAPFDHHAPHPSILRTCRRIRSFLPVFAADVVRSFSFAPLPRVSPRTSLPVIRISSLLELPVA